MVCEAYEKKNKVLLNTIENQKLLMDLAEEKIIKSIREVEKRDHVINRKDSEFQILLDLNESLKKNVQIERRKKNANKLLYAGLGIGLGFLSAKTVFD